MAIVFCAGQRIGFGGAPWPQFLPQGLTLGLVAVSWFATRRSIHEANRFTFGQIVEVAPAGEFFARPRHPYARLLLQALPDARKHGAPLTAIGGSVPPLWDGRSGERIVEALDRLIA